MRVWQLDMKKTSTTRMTTESAKKSEDLTDVERVNFMSESEIEANALCDPDNQPLTADNLKKVHRIERKQNNSMTKRKNQHVVPHEQGWAVKSEGSTKPTQIFSTQKEAEDRAREIAKNQQSEILIHNKKGQIRDRDSYGNDPHPPKG